MKEKKILMIPYINGIMAATKQGVIGKIGHNLPWHYPEEIQHFKKITKDSVLIMGKSTYTSSPKRKNSIVFSRQERINFDGVTTVANIEQCLDLLHKQHYNQQNKVFMIGGAEIATEFLKNNLISHFILTEIHKNYPGEVKLDLDLLKDWPKEVMQETTDYTIYHFLNPKKNQKIIINDKVYQFE